MALPFTKAVACTDQHFGRSSSSPIANQDNLDFFDWYIDEALTWGAETCFLCGDFFDSRHSISLTTMDYAIKGLDKLSKSFKQVYALAGNHDLFYRNRRDISSMTFSRYFPNITPVFEPMTLGSGKEGVTILPWLIGDERKAVKNIDSRYVFSHIEANGYLMNSKVAMPYHEDGISEDDFGGSEYVFSGHFHFRQARTSGKSNTTLAYIGNIMPFNFADEGDADRGMMFLEWGKDPFFKAWPLQPLFKSVKLSDLLGAPQRYLRDKMTARVTMDIDISYEEAQVIKETYVTEYGLRKMELVNQPRDAEPLDFTTDVVFQSVDQIVVDGLLSVQSTGMRPETLVEIYKSLPDL